MVSTGGEIHISRSGRVNRLELFSEVDDSIIQNQFSTDSLIREVRNLDGLTEIRINGTFLTDANFSGLYSSNRLTSLSITNPSGRGEHDFGAKNLGRFPCPWTGASLLGLPAPRKLKKLSIPYTAMTDFDAAQLARFPNLVHLNLMRTGVSSKSVDIVNTLNHLEHLDLRETGVNENGIGRLKCPNLKVFGPPPKVRHRKLSEWRLLFPDLEKVLEYEPFIFEEKNEEEIEFRRKKLEREFSNQENLNRLIRDPEERDAAIAFCLNSSNGVVVENGHVVQARVWIIDTSKGNRFDDGGDVHSLKYLGKFSMLRSIRMYGGSATDHDLDQIRNLNHLTRLYFYHRPGYYSEEGEFGRSIHPSLINGEFLSWIPNPEKVETLNIIGLSINDKTVGILTRFKNANKQNNSARGFIRGLRVSDSAIISSGLECYRRWRPDGWWVGVKPISRNDHSH